MLANRVADLLFRAGITVAKLGQQLFAACQQFADAGFRLLTGILRFAARLL